MERSGKKQLILEKLEPRCLLSGFWQGVDIDGDDVEIELTGPGEFTVTTSEVDLGEMIESIELVGTARSSKLFIDVFPNGGDGFVDVGYIDAADLPLKLISMYGFLGDLEVGSLDKLILDGNLIFDDGPTFWNINSDVKRIEVFGGLENLDIEVAGDLKKVVIEGDFAASTLAVDGRLGRMQIFGNVADDTLIYANEQIRNLSIYGHIDFSVIETNGELKKLYVGYDVIDSEIFAGWAIKKIVTDGSLDNTLVESLGRIRVLDVWDWIVDSEIVAGPEGIGVIWAYNSSNSTVDTPGRIGRVNLDAYGRSEQWSDLVVYVDDVWYWPVYDFAYIDYYYAGGDYYYHYDAAYWDTYYYEDYYDGYYYWDTYYGGADYYDAYYYYGDYYYTDPYYYDPYYYDAYYYDYYYDPYYSTNYYDSYYYDDYYYVDLYYYDNFDWGIGFYADFSWWW